MRKLILQTLLPWKSIYYCSKIPIIWTNPKIIIFISPRIIAKSNLFSYFLEKIGYESSEMKWCEWQLTQICRIREYKNVFEVDLAKRNRISLNILRSWCQNTELNFFIILNLCTEKVSRKTFSWTILWPWWRKLWISCHCFWIFEIFDLHAHHDFWPIDTPYWILPTCSCMICRKTVLSSPFGRENGAI